MDIVKRGPRGQGERGEQLAAVWFASPGAAMFLERLGQTTGPDALRDSVRAVGDGRRWFIPSTAVDGGNIVRLGGPKYRQWEIEPGEPLISTVRR